MRYNSVREQVVFASHQMGVMCRAAWVRWRETSAFFVNG